MKGVVLDVLELLIEDGFPVVDEELDVSYTVEGEASTFSVVVRVLSGNGLVVTMVVVASEKRKDRQMKIVDVGLEFHKDMYVSIIKNVFCTRTFIEITLVEKLNLKI